MHCLRLRGKNVEEDDNFPSTQRSLRALNTRAHGEYSRTHYRYWPELKIGLFSVGGLLCLHRFSYRWDDVSTHGVSSWTVWNPIRNRWKKLPLCKYEVSGQQYLLPDSFVHVFVSDEQTKAYKILMALHHEGRQEKLTTKIYDSKTGIWTDGAEHTLGVELYINIFRRNSVKGVHYNGLIYFVAEHYPNRGEPIESIMPSVYLGYDIGEDEWHEEPVGSYLMRMFEWDGRLMKLDNNPRWLGNEIDFLEWEPVSRMWKDTGIKMPEKIGNLFHRDLGGFSIVAHGNHLAVTGLTINYEFLIAVYKRAENYWRLPPTGRFSSRLRRSLVKGLVLHTPSLDWRPGLFSSLGVP
ncbi:hypothetical protein M758_5G131200 [Ceratodon purpureus]|nr:hypothetical protein M758_5G131200 [Ceratodon purpureus]